MTRGAVALVVALSLAVCGCAHVNQTSISAQDKVTMERLGIAENFKVPAPYYEGRADVLRQMLAISAPAAASGVGSASHTPQTFGDYLSQNDVSFRKLLRQAVTEGLEKHELLGPKLVQGASSLYEFQVSMLNNGIGPVYGFSSTFGVTLGGTARIVDKSGRIIWESYKFVIPLGGDAPTRPQKEYLTQPETLRADVLQAYRLLVEKWLASL